VHHLKFLNSTF
jgi:hypothetical protein